MWNVIRLLREFGMKLYDGKEDVCGVVWSGGGDGDNSREIVTVKN